MGPIRWHGSRSRLHPPLELLVQTDWALVPAKRGVGECRARYQVDSKVPVWSPWVAPQDKRTYALIDEAVKRLDPSVSRAELITQEDALYLYLQLSTHQYAPSCSIYKPTKEGHTHDNPVMSLIGQQVAGSACFFRTRHQSSLLESNR